ncbi:hypothetical protein [Kingella oralis]|uniref:hypothetical protein n=1 Tax=Kingella oralis TaxID=505 RepID=UPI0034E5E2BE
MPHPAIPLSGCLLFTGQTMFPKILLPFALIASACTITPNSIAGIQLGQTPAQV